MRMFALLDAAGHAESSGEESVGSHNSAALSIKAPSTTAPTLSGGTKRSSSGLEVQHGSQLIFVDRDFVIEYD